MKELLAIATQHSIPIQGGELSTSKPKHPVIVIEGLDAAGGYTRIMYIICMSGWVWVHMFVRGEVYIFIVDLATVLAIFINNSPLLLVGAKCIHEINHFVTMQ